MADLKAFLAENVIHDETFEFEVSRRFKDENGEPLKWTIKPLTYEEDERIAKKYYKVFKNPTSGMKMRDLDRQAYSLATTAACIVEPDLNDAALQDSWLKDGQLRNAANTLKAMLYSGELSALMSEIGRIGGGTDGVITEEDLEDAKN